MSRSSFELRWADLAERGVSTTLVTEHLDVIEIPTAGTLARSRWLGVGSGIGHSAIAVSRLGFGARFPPQALT